MSRLRVRLPERRGSHRATIARLFRGAESMPEVIADAAHNSFVTSVFKLMNQVRAQGEWGMLKKRSVTPERRTAYQNEHRLLVSALKDRDLARAKDLTVNHLLHVRRNLLNF